MSGVTETTTISNMMKQQTPFPVFNFEGTVQRSSAWVMPSPQLPPVPTRLHSQLLPTPPTASALSNRCSQCPNPNPTGAQPPKIRGSAPSEVHSKPEDCFSCRAQK